MSDIDFNIESELLRLGLSTAWLCEVCGVERTTLWRWLNGRSAVPAYVKTIIRQQKTILMIVGKG